MSERTDKLPITAAVLAGGRSRRMGVDKTLLEIDGVPMVSRVAAATGEVCGTVLVVTTRPEAAAEAHLPSGVRVVTDEVGYLGPLGGIVTGLAEAPDPWVAVVAADMPWVSAAVIEHLWRHTADADVVVPRGDDGLEPLLALYRVAAALPAARAALEAGERRPVAVYEDLRVAEVPAEDLRAADPGLRSLVNVNTPQDLGRAARERGLPSERAVTVYLNGVEIVTAQATPSDLDELAVGFLRAEGLVTDRARLGDIEVDPRRGTVFVTSSEDSPSDMRVRKRYVTSGCGRGVTFTSAGDLIGVDVVESDLEVEVAAVRELMRQMAEGAHRYRETGGMHACAIGFDGTLELLREDVGRHNALDKVLGAAWLAGTRLDRAVLLTSGRVSSEMAIKAVRAGVPIVASRTTVTDLAAEVADDLGVALIGDVRGDGLAIHTNPWRVRDGGAA